MLGYLRQRETNPAGKQPWIYLGYGRSRSISLVVLPPRCLDMSCFGSPCSTHGARKGARGIFNTSY